MCLQYKRYLLNGRLAKAFLEAKEKQMAKANVKKIKWNYS